VHRLHFPFEPQTFDTTASTSNIRSHTLATMSSNLPLRTIRIPALRQQCLFQRRRSLQLPRAFSTTAPQAFAATCLRLARGQSQFGQEKGAMKALSRNQQGYAPKVTEMKAQREGGLAEDIGLLQDTIIRANWNQLPKPFERAFWAYMWKLTKSRVTGLYS
jgi:protein MBA1